MPDCQVAIGPSTMEVGRVELLEAMKLFHFANGQTIVEIGSIRNESALYSDGHSTIFFAKNAKKVYSVDIDPHATELTRKLTSQYNVEAVTQDGVEYLEHFSEPIDLLYLDGPLCPQFHLDAYLQARKNLHNKSIVVVDDANHSVLYPAQYGEDKTKWPKNQENKARLLLPEVKKDGWWIAIDFYQLVLAKRELLFRFHTRPKEE